MDTNKNVLSITEEEMLISIRKNEITFVSTSNREKALDLFSKDTSRATNVFNSTYTYLMELVPPASSLSTKLDEYYRTNSLLLKTLSEIIITSKNKLLSEKFNEAQEEVERRLYGTVIHTNISEDIFNEQRIGSNGKNYK